MSAATEIGVAREDVERIANAWSDEDAAAFSFTGRPWDEIPEWRKRLLMRAVTRLLERDVIRVGRRPERDPEPLPGQQSMIA